MRCLRLPVVVAALLAVLVSPAPALSPAPHVEISQQLFTVQGNPRLVANFVPDGSLATPSWAVCAPGAASCDPAGVTNQLFEPGAVPAGTTFEASATYAGATSTARGDPWLGSVAATTPPTLTGSAKVGATATPHGGSWSGGWGDEFDVLHVEACRTASGRGCTTIAHPWALRGARRAVAIDPRWSGRYLFAFDQRYADGTAFPEIGYLSPASIAPTPVGPTVARSAALGPVRGPRLALREHPLLRRDGNLLIGNATCARRCDVEITITARGSGAGSGFPLHGTHRLAIDPGTVPLQGPLTIRVRLGDAPLVTQRFPFGGVVAARAR